MEQYVTQQRVLAILYDMAKVIGSESHVQPLLIKTLQRIMFHTSAPCGVFVREFDYSKTFDEGELKNENVHAYLQHVIGRDDQVMHIGKVVNLPFSLLRGAPSMLKSSSLWAELQPDNDAIYPCVLRLYIETCGTILVFFNEILTSKVGYDQVFEPVVGFLLRQYNLCRVNDVYTQRLVDDRDDAVARQKRFRAALDEIDDNIFLIDPVSMRFIDCNKASVEKLGYSQEELMHLGPQDIKFEYSRDQLRTLFFKLIQGEEVSIDLNTMHRCKDGSQFPVESRFTVMDQGKKQPVIIAVARDITDRKQIEDELGQYREQLEDLVEKRTAELTLANEELETFSYSVSHDLRAPLRGMDGFSQALMEDYADDLDDTAKDYLLRIRNNSQRMARLIDDLLSLSRVSRAELDIKEFDLSGFVTQQVQYNKENGHGGNVDWTIEPGVMVNADRRLIGVVIQNLIDNAVKYSSRESQPRIKFFTQESDAEERVYCVADNGVGFDMNYSNKLFGAFQRLHSEADFPGTGIGLATVKRIIQKHGGQVWGESKEGEGATFCFKL